MGHKASRPARSVRLRQTCIRVGSKRRTERMVSKHCAPATILLGGIVPWRSKSWGGLRNSWRDLTELALVRLSFGRRADGSGLVCYNSFRRSGVTELWIEVSLAVHMLSINPGIWLYPVEIIEAGENIGKKKRQQNQGFPTNPTTSWGRSSVG